MNYRLIPSLLLAFLILGSAAQASLIDYTPLLNHPVPVGRLLVYQNENSIFVPTAFDQTLDCDERSGICTLSLYNRLSADEEQVLQTVPSLRAFPADLFKQWVTLNSQGLVGEINDLQTNFFAMKNLALFEKPYGLAYFKTQNPRDLMKRYHQAGLGAFQATYTLSGRVATFELRVGNQALIDFLATQLKSSEFRLSDLKQLIKTQLSVQTTGYDLDDVPTLMAYELKARYLKSSSSGLLQLDENKFSELTLATKNSWLTFGQNTLNGSKTCTLTLPIQANSQMIQTCEDTHANEN